MTGLAFQSPLKTLSYHAEAYDWYQDRYQAVHVSRNRWFCTAWAAMALALLEAAALMALAPLKTSVPFLIKEESSGAVTTVAPLAGDPSPTYDEAIRKYFLGRYIIARETYDPADLAANYRTVDLMSGTAERRLFDQWIASNNPTGPLAVYSSQVRRLIRIKSISFLQGQMAQVRFTSTEQRSSGAPKVAEWIATASWRFGLSPSAESDRFINPLGFCITHYRIDQEVIP
jgi:type IV secretion system protein VirB8